MDRSGMRALLAILWAGVGVLAASACGGGGGGGGTEGPDGGDEGSSEADPSRNGAAGAAADAGGAGGAGGSTTSAPDAGPASCSSDRDCRDRGQLCDVRGGVCVDCLLRADCGEGRTCAGGRCVELRSCNNSLDCAGADGGHAICDPLMKICVECAQDADCDENHVCFHKQCIGYTPCKNSLDCTGEQVCDTGVERCVDCVRDADCGDDGRCVGITCRIACASDRTCTPHGLLCNHAQAYCAECLGHDDCAATEHCELGLCRPDVCAPDEAYCDGNSRVVCNAAGSGFLPPAPCPARHSCTGEPGSAVCRPWVCTAGAKECELEIAVECADDGLSEVGRTDCRADDLNCVHGECSTLVCPPNQLYCDAEENVRLCSSDGLEPGSVYITCSASQYCDASGASPQCRAQVCAPDAAVCNATCNARGSGYVGGAEPCPAGEYCVEGNCTATPPCGDTVCPGAANRCADVSGSCLYVADTGDSSRTAAAATCEALGDGWSLCSEAQICGAEAAPVLGEHCVCPAVDSGACYYASSYLVFHGTTAGYVIIAQHDAACGSWAGCFSMALSVEQTATVCCHGGS